MNGKPRLPSLAAQLDRISPPLTFAGALDPASLPSAEQANVVEWATALDNEHGIDGMSESFGSLTLTRNTKTGNVVAHYKTPYTTSKKPPFIRNVYLDGAGHYLADQPIDGLTGEYHQIPQPTRENLKIERDGWHFLMNDDGEFVFQHTGGTEWDTPTNKVRARWNSQTGEFDMDFIGSIVVEGFDTDTKKILMESLELMFDDENGESIYHHMMDSMDLDTSLWSNAIYQIKFDSNDPSPAGCLTVGSSRLVCTKHFTRGLGYYSLWGKKVYTIGVLLNELGHTAGYHDPKANHVNASFYKQVIASKYVPEAFGDGWSADNIPPNEQTLLLQYADIIYKAVK
jgi:hypothetical protein